MSSESLLSNRSKDLILKYMLGGAAIGGGAALTTSLINYLRHLNKDTSAKDDDTLYVYRDVDGQEKSAMIGGGVAIAGGVLSAVGAYALVKSIYSSLRRRAAQEELDEAQKTFLSTQGFTPVEEVEKKASDGKPMSAFEHLTSLPVAIPLLLALGSGVVAHSLLDRAFPTTKPKVKPPRRIEIIDPPTVRNKSTEPGEELLEKPAGVHEDDAMELLLRFLTIEKRASSDICNLVAAVANGSAMPLKHAIETVGYMDALNLVKGASTRTTDPLAEHLAISYIAKSPLISYPTGVIAAAEFADMHPQFFKMAGALPQSMKDDLYAVTQIFGNAVRAELSEELGLRAPENVEELEKYAMSIDTLSTAIDIANAVNKPVAKGDSAESSSTSGEEAGEEDPDSPSRKNPLKIIASSKTGRGTFSNIPVDEIDKILSPVSPSESEGS